METVSAKLAKPIGRAGSHRQTDVCGSPRTIYTGQGMSERRLSGKILVLLMVNFLVFPLLSLPAYGFIHYMDLRGYYKFTIIGWYGLILTAILIWPMATRCSGLRSYVNLLIAAYVTCIVAWVAGVHKLIFPISDLQHAWRATIFALLVGGLVTTCYWLPASFVNFIVLRHRDDRLRDSPGMGT